MKNLLFLLLLILSSYATSQQLKQNPPAQISPSQVAEIYKVGKERDYYYELAGKQEKALNSAEKLIAEQKKQINTLTALNKKQAEITDNEMQIANKEIAARDAQVDQLLATLKTQEKAAKREARKRTWIGAGGGFLAGAAATIATILILNK